MLISFTGIDGCGKGLQIEFLSAFLERSSHQVFISKAYGQKEKEMFSIFIEYYSQEAIMFLFQAMHTEQRIAAQQALAQGKIVLADRWDESYLVYHSRHGILSRDPDLRNKLNEVAFANITPDITFYIRTPIHIAQQRCIVRGADFFDIKPLSHHRQSEEGLDELAAHLDWFILDGNKPPLEIHREIIGQLKDRL